MSPWWNTALGIVPIVVTFGAIATWLVMYRMGVRPSYDRVDRQQVRGIHREVFVIAYWTAKPMGRGLAKLGLSANAVSWIGLSLGAAAAVGIAVGELGLAATFLFASGIFDVLDGMVARERGTVSRAGAVLDSVLDRSVDFMWHAACAWLWHDNPLLLGLSLLAAHSSFLMSYSSAMADREGVRGIPRGVMKRTERGPLLLVGCCLSVFTGSWEVAHGLPMGVPLAIANGMIAVGATLSAMRRVSALRKALS